MRGNSRRLHRGALGDMGTPSDGSYVSLCAALQGSTNITAAVTPDVPGLYELQLAVAAPCASASALYLLSADCQASPVSAPIVVQAPSLTCLPHLIGLGGQSYRRERRCRPSSCPALCASVHASARLDGPGDLTWPTGRAIASPRCCTNSMALPQSQPGAARSAESAVAAPRAAECSPDNNSLTYQWSLAAWPPGQLVASDASIRSQELPSTVDAPIVPDAPGLWTLSLQACAGPAG